MIRLVFLSDPNYFVQIDKLLSYQMGVKINFAFECPNNLEQEHYGHVVATHPEKMAISVWVQG